jgi:hypothetical protein
VSTSFQQVSDPRGKSCESPPGYSRQGRAILGMNEYFRVLAAVAGGLAGLSSPARSTSLQPDSRSGCCVQGERQPQRLKQRDSLDDGELCAVVLPDAGVQHPGVTPVPCLVPGDNRGAQLVQLAICPHDASRLLLCRGGVLVPRTVSHARNSRR